MSSSNSKSNSGSTSGSSAASPQFGNVPLLSPSTNIVGPSRVVRSPPPRQASLLKEVPAHTNHPCTPNHFPVIFKGGASLREPAMFRFDNYLAKQPGVTKAIEGKLRKFLWCGSVGQGYSKVAWGQGCLCTNEGRFRIHNIKIMNPALMIKHFEEIIQQDIGLLWVARITRYRLKDQTIWTTYRSTGSWCWRKLIKLVTQFPEGAEYEVGSGHKFKLWFDPLHADGYLIHRYHQDPSLIGLLTGARAREGASGSGKGMEGEADGAGEWGYGKETKARESRRGNNRGWGALIGT
ncbi:UNVERIFIED_CONTAM: hypothetical protein Sradi_3568800 [Sesamum radiatum]|uniref:Uncharacterized protein n=1 Tax=Sesamum radiatum TaxID=300843 RepID=A0AAW2QG10_SESRA